MTTTLDFPWLAPFWRTDPAPLCPRWIRYHRSPSIECSRSQSFGQPKIGFEALKDLSFKFNCLISVALFQSWRLGLGSSNASAWGGKPLRGFCRWLWWSAKRWWSFCSLLFKLSSAHASCLLFPTLRAGSALPSLASVQLNSLAASWATRCLLQSLLRAAVATTLADSCKPLSWQVPGVGSSSTVRSLADAHTISFTGVEHSSIAVFCLVELSTAILYYLEPLAFKALNRSRFSLCLTWQRGLCPNDFEWQPIIHTNSSCTVIARHAHTADSVRERSFVVVPWWIDRSWTSARTTLSWSLWNTWQSLLLAKFPFASWGISYRWLDFETSLQPHSVSLHFTLWSAFRTDCRSPPASSGSDCSQGSLRTLATRCAKKFAAPRSWS